MNTHRRITTLGELVTSRAGKTPLTTNPAFWEGSVPWVTAKDLKQFRVKDSIDRITGAAVDDGAPMAVAGDVLILVRGMTLLKDVPIAICENPVSFNQDVRCLSAKPGVDSEYLALFLEASKGRIRNFISVAGHGTGRLDSEALMTLPIALLGKNSEARVARHFRAVERAIQLTDALIAAKREQKRGLMQQLLTGKVRFSGFTEPWKTVRLGDVVSIDPEQLSATTPADYTFRYIDLSSVNNGRIELPTSKTEFASAPSRARRVLMNGDVLLSTVRPLLKGFGILTSDSGPFVGSTGFAVLRATCQEDSRFVFECLFSAPVLRQMHARTTGSSYPALGAEDVRELRIPWPSTSERNKIEALLTATTRELQLLEDRRCALTSQRRGLMERLLRGDIALPSSDTSAA